MKKNSAGRFQISLPACQIFEKITKDLSADDFITPKCVVKLIGEAVRRGAQDLK
jgi:hypothetical protein